MVGPQVAGRDVEKDGRSSSSDDTRSSLPSWMDDDHACPRATRRPGSGAVGRHLHSNVAKYVFPGIVDAPLFLLDRRPRPTTPRPAQGFALALVVRGLAPQLQPVAPQFLDIDRLSTRSGQNRRLPVCDCRYSLRIGGADLDGMPWLFLQEMAIGRSRESVMLLANALTVSTSAFFMPARSAFS